MKTTLVTRIKNITWYDKLTAIAAGEKPIIWIIIPRISRYKGMRSQEMPKSNPHNAMTPCVYMEQLIAADWVAFSERPWEGLTKLCPNNPHVTHYSQLVV